MSKEGLTREERHLLDGIKLAWLTSEGRRSFYKTIARKAVVGMAIVILTILIGKSLMTGTERSLTRSVSAKTVGKAVEDVFQATVSAVFREKN